MTQYFYFNGQRVAMDSNSDISSTFAYLRVDPPSDARRNRLGSVVISAFRRCQIDFSNPLDYPTAMYLTVVEVPEFRRRIASLLEENEQEKLITYLSMQPKAGVLIQGTGGVRKLRWARPGSGKSGGMRIIYFFHNENMPLFLLTAFAKNEKENLSKAERNQLAVLTKRLVETYRKKLS